MKKIVSSLIVFGFAYVGVINAQSDIRKVDFKNFTYEPYCLGEDVQKIKVENGEFFKETEEDGYTDRFYFGVTVDGYGDVDGDGKDEAVISSICNTGKMKLLSRQSVIRAERDNFPKVLFIR